MLNKWEYNSKKNVLLSSDFNQNWNILANAANHPIIKCFKAPISDSLTVSFMHVDG